MQEQLLRIFFSQIPSKESSWKQKEEPWETSVFSVGWEADGLSVT